MHFFKKLMSYFFFISTATAGALPEGFVYVKDIDPSIIQNLRYHTAENFIGKPMPKYHKPTLILTREAALALSRVQKEVMAEGYSLVIYDAYRPQGTVDNFVVWSRLPADPPLAEKYYPRVAKTELFDLGYIADKSSHSRGSTVDLTLISTKNTLRNAANLLPAKRKLKDGSEIIYLDDGTVDMGSSFDLFDIASHHDSTVINEEFTEKRNYLRQKMLKHGFTDYPQEWWHFTLKNEPFPNTYFDFEIR